MLKFGKRIDGIGGRRLAVREPVLLAASVLTLARARCATVVNVSATGARLRGCGDVAVGEDLWVKVGIIDCLSNVAWRKGDLCGITFDEPLDDDDLRHLRCEAKNTLVMRMSPEERLAATDWITGFAR